MNSEARSIDGLLVIELRSHDDERGALVEFSRQRWTPNEEWVQWNAVRSETGVLRGVHCHVTHSDYITMGVGSMVLGLRDLRPDSPTRHRSQVIQIRAGSLAVVIPPGVAHGFYFPEPSLTIYGVTHEWSTADELGCRWDDPALGLDWPCSNPLLSARDRVAGTLAELEQQVSAAMSAG